MTSGYYLISKIKSVPYYKYKGDALRLLNQTARTVDEVVVGIKGQPQLQGKITTFKDSNGNIIERAMDLIGKPYKNRIYTKRDNVICNDEFVTSVSVKEYYLNKSMKDAHIESVALGNKRTLLWTPIKFFTNHLSENVETGEKVLTKVIQTNLLKPQKEIHTFIEYPHIINGKITKTAKKILKFGVNTLNGYKINLKILLEQGTKLPQNDEYLGLRALEINDSKTAFAQKFLIKLGLKNKRITINPDYVAQNNYEELTKALFDPNDGSINFVKGYIFKSKSEICNTARHESEHGWQFYLHARNIKGEGSPWEEKIYDLFRDLPKTLRKEAQEYTDSIRSYVTVVQDKIKYKQNLIEQKAKLAGQKESALYDYERREIQNNFPHIPQELL